MKFNSLPVKIFLAVFAGAVSGLLGGGGGMLCVPLLLYCFKLEVKQAHATAVILMMVCSSVASAGYAGEISQNYLSLIYVMIGGVCGGLLGGFALHKLKAAWLQKAFACLMVAAGIMMVIKGANF